jgi:hypothetical protein
LIESEILFEEKQYLGHNRFSIVIRTVLTLFCFVGYYWSENPKPVHTALFDIGSYPMREVSNSGKMFFILGLSILILSAALTYVLHIHTLLKDGVLELKGFRTSRKIRIPFQSIEKIRKSRYKPNIWRRAVYNLHNTGSIRFYTSGEDFVEITDKQGFIYRIGSQRVDQLYAILKSHVPS